ncbi:MAG TPA: DUF1579 family protein [Terriglobales bacterium]
MKLRLTLIALLFANALPAIAQMQPPKPSPELKKLDYFVGTWNFSADVKANPDSPGGKVTGTEAYNWMDGGFFLAGNSEYIMQGMKTTGPAFMGYDTNDKMFTYDSYDSVGEATHAKGTFDGTTWTFSSEQKMGPQTFKGRYTMKVVSPTSYNLKYEMSPDGANWMTVMEGTATKK